MELLSAKDLPYIKITDFMAAIGRKPIRKDGDLIVYEAPYNCAHLYREYGIETKDKPTCVVDTVSNSWYDSKISHTIYGVTFLNLQVQCLTLMTMSLEPATSWM